MLYAIEIGSEKFDLNEIGEGKRAFSYCEKKFGFKGSEWEEIKSEYDYERLDELLDSVGVRYEEYLE